MLEGTSRGAAAQLPIEGELPDLGGATAWLNSEPLTPAALYVADPDGRLRDHHFGEGRYEGTGRVIQQLLAEVGSARIDDGPLSVDVRGIEVAADFAGLESPETYVGYARAERFVSPGRVLPDRARAYADPPRLGLNEWSLYGNWTVGRQATAMNEAGGRISYRFRARDVNLVLGPSASGDPVRFRVLIDGHPPGEARGLDVDDDGKGTVAEARLYQLVRQPGRVSDRTFEITFLDAGVRAYVFTFG